MKKGFTLIELLVVIVIIGVLSVVIVPSLMKINDNVNQRLLSEKIENIENASQLYARNNEEIFNGTTNVKIYVYQLIESNYLTADMKNNSKGCTEENEKGLTEKGCVQNPVNKTSMNNDYVELTRNGVGYRAEYISQVRDKEDYDPTTLVQAVCAGYASGELLGQAYSADGEVVSCKCNDWHDPQKLITNDGEEVEACLITGDSPQNYLRYGSSNEPNWRVLGLYKLEEGISAKMITIGPIKE